MTASFRLAAMSDLDETDRMGIKEMKTAVYPPAQFADSPGRLREWLAPMWGVLTEDVGVVVSFVGVVATKASLDGRAVEIGGVGGVATHPDNRGLGLAAQGIEMACDFLVGRGVEFNLLVCRDELTGYYHRLGWALFGGTTLVRQRGETEVFTFNRVMLRDGTGPAPAGGTLDLLGPPW